MMHIHTPSFTRRLCLPRASAALLMLAGCDPVASAPDASAPPLDAGSSAPDAALPAVDATTVGSDAASSAGDASNADASWPEASNSDAGVGADGALGTDAGSDDIRVTSSGTQCLTQQRQDASLLCADQACISDNNQVTAVIRAGVLTCLNPGSCEIPTPAAIAQAPAGTLTHEYVYKNADFSLLISFDGAVLTSYSLDNFRKALVDSTAVQAKLAIDGAPTLTNASANPDKVEFVSYENGLLHLRVTALIDRFTREFDDVPHPCTIGDFGSSNCSKLICWYGDDVAGGAGRASRITADITIGLEPLR